MEKNLKEMVRRFGVEKNVFFIGGVPYSKMPEYLASVDVYVDTWKSENKPGDGLGATNMEAMSSGTPTILATKSYNKNYFKKAEWFYGLEYEPLNYKQLAKKIVYLLENKKLRKKIGKKSRQSAIKYFDWNKLMKKWENVYKDLVE